MKIRTSAFLCQLFLDMKFQKKSFQVRIPWNPIKNPIKSTSSIVTPSFHLHPQKTLRGQPAPPALGAASSAAATAGAAPRAPRRGRGRRHRRRRSVAGAAGAERGAVAGGEGLGFSVGIFPSGPWKSWNWTHLFALPNTKTLGLDLGPCYIIWMGQKLWWSNLVGWTSINPSYFGFTFGARAARVLTPLAKSFDQNF